VSDLARIGGPVACIGLAVLLTARRRGNRIAGLGYAAFGTALLIASLAPPKALELGLTIGGGLVLAPALAWVLHREPWLVAFATLGFVPLRVGLLSHQLLVPLYAVAAGAALLLLWELLRGDERSRELGIVAKPLGWFVAWTGISLAWSPDVHEGAIEVLAFYVPFTILALSIARLQWSRGRVRVLYGELVAMGLAFAAVGFYQYETRDIFQNPKVITGNAYAAFFRVNSVFWDPSVYGRFLVVALIPTLVVVVRGRSGRAALAGVAGIVVLWLGLLISFSQSSFAALLVGVIGVAAVAWRWRSLVAVIAAAAVLAGIAAGEPRIRHALVHHTSSGLNSATSGRASLVANGIRIAEAHPAIGVGVGGFKSAYAKRIHLKHLKGKEPKTAASHDTPVTVAAEEGGIGLLLFAWLLVALGVQGTRRFDRSFAARVSLSVALALAAILVHSLFYNDFFEDPTTWGLFGMLALAAPRRVPAQEPPPAVENREPVAV
jgi:putative inorganic carbon (HCO3(-)) transporter